MTIMGPNNALAIMFEGTGPSIPVRGYLMGGAYLLAALIVQVVSLLGGAPLGDPLYFIWGLFVLFPYGLARFFESSWSFAPHIVYLALTAQIFIPSAKVFFSLFALFVLLLCFNVVGCVQPLNL